MKILLIKRNDGLLEPYDDKALGVTSGLPFQPIEFDLNQKRTLSQNALVNVWYDQIDKQLNQLPGETRKFCKLTIGVPILRAESEEFRVFYDKALKWQTYEEKLKSMVFVPITSIMSKEQLSRYAEAMQVKHAEMGIILHSD